MNKKKKTTLKSIAQHLNISVTTVSRALSGYDDVNAKTKLHIQEAARALGYVPNLAARRLVTGKSNAIGILLPVPYGDMRDHFLSHFLLHFGRSLHTHNPNLDLIVSYAPEGDEELSTYQRFIDGQRVDAFVVMRTRRNDVRVDLLQEQNIPFVTHGRTESPESHNWIDSDAISGFDFATQSLIDKGHKNVVLLNLPERIFTSQMRTEGYINAMERAGLTPHTHITEVVDDIPYKISLDLLQQKNAPTGFICASDVIAHQVVRAAKHLGIDPCLDINIIGCDDLPVSYLGDPTISTLRSSFEAHSQAIINILQSQLNGQVFVPRNKLIDYELIERQTSNQAFLLPD
ncbi:LacI family DNA-binding transcriptional regulator [Marinomonas sp. 2405UD68-3]|uniref:LacI family DNA-binding transcriptional regulator n=1 Tax=Marinomonas sp. 2405UD68-3 TaxID=3391835 RepID=UPI0039C95DD9